MTECQGCGAWNETSRTLCVLCGTPLAETDEWDAAADLPPLPPLPDGGLAASMPAWLRDSPADPVSLPEATTHEEVLAPLGPRADPRTFLADDDFPRWLRDLAVRERVVATVTMDEEALTSSPPRPAEWGDRFAWPGWPGAAAADLDGPVLAPGAIAETRPPATEAAARARAERRGWGAWEMLLLVLLFIGVIVAAVWALISNGVFGPGL